MKGLVSESNTGIGMVVDYDVAYTHRITHSSPVFRHINTQLQVEGPWPEIGVLLLELGVGLVSRVSLVSHMVRVRAMLCMLV